MELLRLDEFIKQFKLPVAGYDNPVEFIDGNFGFSISKDYSNGYASLLRLYISKEALKADKTILPLTITCSYGKKTDGGITLSSSAEKIRRLFDPIELLSTDEFYYQLPEQKFIYNGLLFKNRTIDPPQIVERINLLHRKPTRPLRGFWLRIKILFWRVIVAALLKFTSNTLVLLLYITSGTRISRDIWSRIILPDRLEEKTAASTNFADKRAIDFFGYKASAWVITFYCSVHFIAYALMFYYGIRPAFVTTIFKNTFVTIIYVVVTLSLVDFALPRALKFLVGRVDNLFHAAGYKRIRI